MRRLLVLLSVLGGACGIQETPDFLIGRSCVPQTSECDPLQACLPHSWGASPGDFRCRDANSLEPIQGVEPPLAYCDEEMGFVCPPETVCNVDRVRGYDQGIRRMVCQKPGSPFSPPRS